MRAGNDQLRTLRILVDLQQEDLDPLAGPIALGWHLLAGRHDRFGLAELDDHRAGVSPLDDAVDDFALAIGEFLIDSVAFVIANALQERLAWRSARRCGRSCPASVRSGDMSPTLSSRQVRSTPLPGACH